MKRTKTKEHSTRKKEPAGAVQDSTTVAGRGRIFQGYVTKKFPTRVVVEFERIIYVPKYERFTKSKTRLHARIQQGMSVNIGDLVKLQECRPLSKIIRFIVTEIVRKAHVEEAKAK